jgi:hypothetical protein
LRVLLVVVVTLVLVVVALPLFTVKEQYPSYNLQAEVTSWLLYLHRVTIQLLRKVEALGRKS